LGNQERDSIPGLRRIQGERQKAEGKRGMAWWAARQQRLEEKSEKPLKSFEQPSNNHRRTIEEPS
jgi:hypothetical protein